MDRGVRSSESLQTLIMLTCMWDHAEPDRHCGPRLRNTHTHADAIDPFACVFLLLKATTQQTCQHDAFYLFAQSVFIFDPLVPTYT